MATLVHSDYRDTAASPALSALIRKRAELAGEAEALDARLAHLDAAIRILCPEAKPELIRPRKPSRKGCDWFGRQELPRLLLGRLRGAAQPLSTLELARAVMVHKGMNPGDAVALRRVAGMVKGVLHRQEGRTVERVADPSTAARCIERSFHLHKIRVKIFRLTASRVCDSTALHKKAGDCRLAQGPLALPAR